VVRVGGHAVVVGGGIGGLAAAVALHGVGWDVTVLERAPELAEVGAGVSLWPNAVRALQSIDPGLARVLSGRWALQGAAGVRATGGRWLVRMDASWIQQRYGVPVLLVARPELHMMLAGLVPAGAVRLGCTAQNARAAGSRAVVSGIGPTGGFEIETDLVVAADGVHSALRRFVDPRAAARYAGHTAWRALVPPALAPQVAESGDTWGPGRRFGYAPMGDGRVYWFASAPAAANGAMSPGELRTLRERFAGWHEPIPALLAATPPAALLRNDVLQLRPPPRRLAAGRIALLGDAGHAMTPDLGQGACQALEDAAELAAMAAQVTPAEIPATLGRYDAARRARTRMVMRRSRSIARLAHLQGSLRCALRDHLAAAAGALTRDRALDEMLGWHPSR
jgi:2-polyprenyl-6-methoxyphenol hydroxylase-like FAD-dependent oxidoreductase